MAGLTTRGLQVSSLWPVCPTACMQTFAAEAIANGNQSSGRNSWQGRREAAPLVACRGPKTASNIEIFHWIYTDTPENLLLQILLLR